MRRAQYKIKKDYNTRIAMANDVFSWIEDTANAESGGNAEIGDAVENKLNKMLNNIKADLLGSKKVDEDKRLKADCLTYHINGKTVEINISYYATQFYDNYSLIYLRNTNRVQIKASECRDLVFVDIVEGSPEHIKYVKTKHLFDRSTTKPFYHV